MPPGCRQLLLHICILVLPSLCELSTCGGEYNSWPEQMWSPAGLGEATNKKDSHKKPACLLKWASLSLKCLTCVYAVLWFNRYRCYKKIIGTSSLNAAWILQYCKAMHPWADADSLPGKLFAPSDRCCVSLMHWKNPEVKTFTMPKQSMFYWHQNDNSLKCFVLSRNWIWVHQVPELLITLTAAESGRSFDSDLKSVYNLPEFRVQRGIVRRWLSLLPRL